MQDRVIEYIAKIPAQTEIIAAIQQTFDEYSTQLDTEIMLATELSKIWEVSGKTIALEQLQRKLHEKLSKIIQA